MKKMTLALAPAILALVAAAVDAAEPGTKLELKPSAESYVPKADWAGVYVEGDTDERKCFYEIGEPMTFRLKLGGGKIPAGDWTFRWKRTGDDGKVEEGTAPLPVTEPFVYRTTLDRSGFVRLFAEVVGAGPNVKFDGGAGAGFDKIVQTKGEPADFDAFWARELKALADLPLDPQLEEVASPRVDVKLCRFRLGCTHGKPSTGFISIPRRPGKYPVRLRFFGYNESWSPRATAVPSAKDVPNDEIVLRVNAHGLENGRDAAYYAAARKAAGSNGYGHGFDPAENAKPETCYFLGMVLRGVRAAQWAKTLPEWNGRKMIVYGGSQGGAQSLWVTALEPAVTDAEVFVPWMCDFRGKALGGRSGTDWGPAYAPGLDYFDIVNFAKRIRPGTYVNIFHAGLGDYICPPSGIASLYHALRCRKRLVWVQNGEHGWTSPAKNRRTTEFASAPAPARTQKFAIPSAMETLRPGEVRPEGWLRDRCLAAKNGYISRMDEIDQAFPRAWNREFHPRGRFLDWTDPNKGAWCTEGGAYWFEGLVRLAWELNDPALKAYATTRLSPLLERMNPNALGFVYWMDRRDPAQLDELERANHGFIIGASGRTTRAFLAYYEATGDARALQALKWCLDDPRCYFFGNPVTLPAAGCDTWRYCGDAKLAAALENFKLKYPTLSADKWPALRYGHVVRPETIHQEIRNDKDRNANWEWRLQHGVLSHESAYSFLKLAQWSGDAKLLADVQSWADYWDRHTRQVHGVTVADEQYGAPGADRGTETCTVAGDILLYSTLAGVTGEGRFGDHVERAFFNAGAACVSRDWMQHVYFQAPNRIAAIGKFHAGPAGKGGVYQRKHWPLCCTAALARILPGYVQWMWMKPATGGLAAVLYGPNSLATEVVGTALRIETETAYPFDETIALTVRPEKTTAFPLRLRIPAWCDQPEIAVNGERLGGVPIQNGFATIERPWADGDQVTLKLPMAPQVERVVDANQGGKPYCAVTAGPLLFAWAVPAKDENTPLADVRTDWALDSKRILSGAQIVRTAMPRVWDWPEDAPIKVSVKTTDGHDLSLVPYGCARLRVTLFPDASPAR